MENDPIIIRASAQNSHGNGPFSDPSPTLSRARMVPLPPLVTKPFEEKRGANSVTIGWESAFGGDEKGVYELFVDSGMGTGYTDVFYTTRTYFKVKNLERAGVYKFKLRTRTSCDHGPYSPELVVNFKSEPTVCASAITVNVRRVSCSVVIDWTESNAAIGYNVEVKGANPPDFLPLKDLC